MADGVWASPSSHASNSLTVHSRTSGPRALTNHARNLNPRETMCSYDPSARETCGTCRERIAVVYPPRYHRPICEACYLAAPIHRSTWECRPCSTTVVVSTKNSLDAVWVQLQKYGLGCPVCRRAMDRLSIDRY